MKIGIVATHSFPIPYKTHTGDICILDLAVSLKQFGHEVHLFAPAGTEFDQLHPMKCSYGQYPPAAEECEKECLFSHYDTLKAMDIIHDFSVGKTIALHFKNSCSTLLGGPWLKPVELNNVIVWSQAHRNRVLRGATDYEGTPTPDLGGPNGYPVKDALVVNGGIDTGFYCPDKYEKDAHFLWMNRWTEIRGYNKAIELAKRTGIPLVLSGEHPDNAPAEYHKQCALQAAKAIEGWDNIRIEWLPPDPHHHSVKRNMYRRARALLYTIEFGEPFGLTQVEALACGTPVIGNNYGSVSEVVNHGETGFVCNNMEELIEAVKNIDTIDPQACRKNATQRFDRRVFAKNCLKVYEQIIGAK